MSAEAIIAKGFGVWANINTVPTHGFGTSVVLGIPKLMAGYVLAPGITQGQALPPGITEGQSRVPGITQAQVGA